MNPFGAPAETPEEMIAAITAILNDQVEGVDFDEGEKLGILTGYLTGLAVAIEMTKEGKQKELSSELFDRLLELNGMLNG